MTHQPSQSQHAADDLRLAIVASTYHQQVTTALRHGAREAFLQAGGKLDHLMVVEAPGAFELTALCAEVLRSTSAQGAIALGCVITGETPHDEYINQSVTQGLTSLVLETGKPVGFGLLTCRTMEQAVARSGGDKGNKGAEAMHAVISSVHLIQSIRKTATLDSGSISI